MLILLKLLYRLVARLSRNNFWTERQVGELCRAVVMNKQIEWIIGDPDIYKFYRNLLGDLCIPEQGPIKNVYDMLHEADDDKK